MAPAAPSPSAPAAGLPPVRRRLACLGLLAALTACGGSDPESDYTLQLIPRTLGGQVPFASSPEVRLYLDPADAPRRIVDLGTAGDTPLTHPQLPPLPEGTLVGLLAEQPGGEAGKYNPGRLVAYGQLTLDRDLAGGGAHHELPVLVAQRGHIGDLGVLDAPDAVALPGFAMAPGGDLYLFGGAPSPHEPATDRILALTDLNGGDWTFRPTDLRLPAPLADLTATPVVAGGTPLILLAGGRPDLARIDGNTDTALLFDPETEAIVWGDDPAASGLPLPRSGHQALVRSDGTVLLLGGYSGSDGLAGASWTAFDPTTRTFPASGDLPIGAIGAAAASVGSAGVIACGGVDLPHDADTPPLVHDTCVGLNLQGVPFEVPPLPVPLAHHAMAPLPGGGVLVAGGLPGPATDDEPVHATDRAWVFDGEVWQEVAGLAHPRARHVLVPVPRHDILAVGGIAWSDWFGVEAHDAVLCPEGYSPASRTFTDDPTTCTRAGSGADPRWTWRPGVGAAGLQGWDGASGGRHYGLTAFGPDL